MVIMLRLNQAALPSFQLFVLCQVFAGFHQLDHRDILVSRGESVNLTCNISVAKLTQISWTKDKSIFSHSTEHSQTFSNLTSDRVTIHLNLPSTLNIFNVQHSDTGLYKCDVTGRKGARTMEWNLTLSDEPEEVRPSSWFTDLSWIFLISVSGSLLFSVPVAICFCRKLGTRTSNQNLDCNQVVYTQSQSGTDRRYKKHRSQYIERLNSIYGAY